MIYTVEVDYVHDHESLKAGREVDGTHSVVVQADSPNEAELLAAQIVGSTQGIPTATRLMSEAVNHLRAQWAARRT